MPETSMLVNLVFNSVCPRVLIRLISAVPMPSGNTTLILLLAGFGYTRIIGSGSGFTIPVGQFPIV